MLGMKICVELCGWDGCLIVEYNQREYAKCDTQGA